MYVYIRKDIKGFKQQKQQDKECRLASYRLYQKRYNLVSQLFTNGGGVICIALW